MFQLEISLLWPQCRLITRKADAFYVCGTFLTIYAFLRAAKRWASGRVGALSWPLSASFCSRDQCRLWRWRCFIPTTTMHGSKRSARTPGSVRPGALASEGSPGDWPKCRRSGRKRRMCCSWMLGTSFREPCGLTATKAQKQRILWTSLVMMSW